MPIEPATSAQAQSFGKRCPLAVGTSLALWLAPQLTPQELEWGFASFLHPDPPLDPCPLTPSSLASALLTPPTLTWQVPSCPTTTTAAALFSIFAKGRLTILFALFHCGAPFFVLRCLLGVSHSQCGRFVAMYLCFWSSNNVTFT